MEEVKYKFTAIGRNSTKEVFPQNGNTFAVTWEKEEEKAFFSKKLKGKMLFTGEDFHWLYVYENSQYKCDPITLIIEKNCSGEFAEFIVSRLILNKADWDLDQCTCSIEAEEEDRYTCYNDNKDKEVNLLQIVPLKKTVGLLQGTLEYQDCSGLNGEDQWCGLGSVAEGWTVLSFYQTDPDGTGGFPDPGSFNIKWVREVISSVTPLGAPWISIGGGQYAKAPSLYGYRSYGGQFDRGYDYQVGGSIDNGMALKDCFEALINQSCYPMTVKSNFFNWNSDDPSNHTNYVTEQLSKVENLILFQKSDVKRPNTSNNATIANITLEKLIKDICNIFQLKWDIDEDGNFIIEHVSFFQKGVGLNLVGRFDQRLREGKRKYSYDLDNMPKKELFQFMDDKYTYGDFKGVPIIYSNSCAGKGDKQDKDWIVENIITDVSFVLNNPSSDSQIVSDDGFVLIACDENNKIISEAPILGGNTLNNTLSWGRLHVDYWRFQRVFNRFSMNNVQTNALSVVPTKKGVTLDVTLCCGEVFDPENKVLSQLGEGIVSEANFDLYKENLTLTLLYGSDEEIIVNEPPIANNDVAETFKGITIDIDVLANDEGSEINPGTLTIVYGSANGTASIVDNKIRYTPNPEFVGDDVISYTVKNDWEETSNVGIVNIIVKTGSPLPIANDDNFTTGEDVVLTVGTVLSNDTGDGILSCIPETKATEEGGSVQIYANGSFVYTPPAGYVGEDGFSYTLKDANDNTDVGHVNITVFEKSQVYVRYSEESVEDYDIQGFCMPFPGSPPTEEVIGSKTVFDLYVKFYSDALGTVPLNVSGYGIHVKLKQTRTGDGAFSTIYNIPASGTQYYQPETVSDWNQTGCEFGGGEGAYYYEDTFSLETSIDYIIL